MSKLAAEEPSILHCHIGARTHARASRCDCRCSPHLTQIVKRVARRVRLSHRGPRKRAAVLFGAVDGRELVVQLRRRHSCQSVQLSRATVAHLLRLSREGRQHRQRAVQVEAEQSAQAEPGRLSSHSGGSRRRPEIRRQPHGARRVSSGKVLRELGVEAARVGIFTYLLHLLLTYLLATLHLVTSRRLRVLILLAWLPLQLVHVLDDDLEAREERAEHIVSSQSREDPDAPRSAPWRNAPLSKVSQSFFDSSTSSAGRQAYTSQPRKPRRRPARCRPRPMITSRLDRGWSAGHSLPEAPSKIMWTAAHMREEGAGWNVCTSGKPAEEESRGCARAAPWKTNLRR